jgi:hypothetical protein
METNEQNNPKPTLDKSTEELVQEARVTKEDLEALGPKDDNLRDDGGDDELLLERTDDVDFAGEELDVPGSELDDDQERLGSEDEENNPYSTSDDGIDQ